MEATQFGGNGSDGPLVISRSDEGFRAYSVANPGQSYLVSGSAEAPVCTCSELQNRVLGTSCRHIEAVLHRYGRGNDEAETDNYAREERSRSRMTDVSQPTRDGSAARRRCCSSAA
jgi:hypothetical protein